MQWQNEKLVLYKTDWLTTSLRQCAIRQWSENHGLVQDGQCVRKCRLIHPYLTLLCPKCRKSLTLSTSTFTPLPCIKAQQPVMASGSLVPLQKTMQSTIYAPAPATSKKRPTEDSGACLTGTVKRARRELCYEKCKFCRKDKQKVDAFWSTLNKEKRLTTTAPF